MSSRAASRREHQRFCEIEEWAEVLNATGKPTEHHITYELALGDGRVYRTRISRPANTDTYGKGMWSHILDDQLHATEAEFWDCVDNKNPPNRSTTAADPEAVALPASLAYQLVNTLHLSSEEVAMLSLEQAVAKMAEHWAKPAE
ncbi:MAG: hypothetical protein QOE09_1656 [Ilumatobacteraceae bacterium]